MGAYSGLGARKRRHARYLVVAMCKRLLAHPSYVHYTQLSQRWDGIAHRKGIHTRGFWPYYGDCSSTATHIMWRALHVAYKVRDIINHAQWRAGYTGSQWPRGKRVRFWLKVGDFVFYGGYGGNPTHVAVVMKAGTWRTARVMSHGSEGGPYYLPARYRGDVRGARRYI